MDIDGMLNHFMGSFKVDLFFPVFLFFVEGKNQTLTKHHHLHMIRSLFLKSTMLIVFVDVLRF